VGAINDIELSRETTSETTRRNTEVIGDSEMEHDGTSQDGSKLEMEGDNEKIRKKREKPNHSYEDEGTGKETEDDGPEAGNMMTPQQNSPKRTKKIKVERDPTQPHERTRNKTRIKHLKDHRYKKQQDAVTYI
jgi:hypothetical protein